MCTVCESFPSMLLCCVLTQLQVDSTMSIKAYYAGHVLGAAMFEIRVGQQSVVYTVSVVTGCDGDMMHLPMVVVMVCYCMVS